MVERSKLQSLPAVALIILASTPAGAQPVVSPELPIADRVPGPAKAIQSAVASDGSQSLVVWIDDTRFPREVMAARVAHDGTLVDPLGILVAQVLRPANPAVGFDGTHYLVAWVSGFSGDAIYAVRLDPNGTVIDTVPLHVADLPGGGAPTLDVAGSPGQFLITWHGNQTISLRRLTGVSFVDPAPIVIADTDYIDMGPSAAFDGTNYLVTWALPDMVRTARLPTAGPVLDPTGLDIVDPGLPGGNTIDIAFGGTDHLIAWEYHGIRVGTNGQAVGSVPYDYPLTGQPSLASDGAGYLHVSESGPGGVTIKRLDSSGAVLSSSSIPTDAPFPPKVTFDGQNYLVAYPNQYVAFGALVSPTGSVLMSDLPIARALNDQYSVAAEYGDTDGYLATWRDSRGGLYAARLAPDGTSLDGPGFVISPSVVRASVFVAHAPSGSAPFVVAWYTPTQPDLLRATRVTPGGQVLDPGGFVVGPTRQESINVADVACTATVCLFVWSPAGARLDAIRYDLVNGTMLDAAPFMLTNFAQGIRLATDGNDFVAQYSGSRGVTMRHIPVSGPPGPEFGVGLAFEGGREGDIVWAGSSYVTAWGSALCVDDPTCPIIGTHLGRDGQPLHPPVVLASGLDSASPYVVHDGTQSVVLWPRFNGMFNPTTGEIPTLEIWATTFSADGVVGTPGGVQLALPSLEAGIALVNGLERGGFSSGTAGRFLVAGGLEVSQPPQRGRRAAAWFVEMGTPVTLPPPDDVPGAEQGGCGCRVDRSGPSGTVGTLLLLVVLVAVRYRRSYRRVR